MFVHTRSSDPKRLAKFGWQTRTFCHKKVGKVIAKLESDRLYKHVYIISHVRTPSANKRWRSFIKGELKAHIYISLYESNTLQE